MQDKIFLGLEDLMKMLDKLQTKMSLSCRDKSIKKAIERIEGLEKKKAIVNSKDKGEFVGPVDNEQAEDGQKRVRILTLDDSGQDPTGNESSFDNAKALICYHLNENNKHSIFSQLKTYIMRIDNQQNKLLALNKDYEERI